MKKIQLLNTYVNNVSLQDAIESIDQMIVDGKKTYVVAVNTDVMVKIENDPYLKEIVDQADLVLVDGKPLVWVSKLYKRPVKEKVSGSDLVPELCDLAVTKNYRLFFLGGREGVAELAQKNVEADYPGIQVVGTYSPPFGFERDERELDRINQIISEAEPDILVACFGCPKQEKWIYENFMKYNAKVSICAGATIDFLAGTIKRCPKWMSEHGMEWFYRFLQEPQRLFRRYFIDDIKILSLIVKYRRKNIEDIYKEEL